METKPSYKPTSEQRAQVNAMAAYGVPQDAIAGVLKIDPKTLRKHFRDELDHAGTVANSAVAQSLYRKATGDGPQSVTAAIFWAKTRMGWRESPTELQLTGKLHHKIEGDAAFGELVKALDGPGQPEAGSDSSETKLEE